MIEIDPPRAPILSSWHGRPEQARGIKARRLLRPQRSSGRRIHPAGTNPLYRWLASGKLLSYYVFWLMRETNADDLEGFAVGKALFAFAQVRPCSANFDLPDFAYGCDLVTVDRRPATGGHPDRHGAEPRGHSPRCPRGNA